MESGFVGNDNPRMKRRTDKDIENIKNETKQIRKETERIKRKTERITREIKRETERIKKYSKEMDQKLEDIKKQNANHCRFPVFNF